MMESALRRRKGAPRPPEQPGASLPWGRWLLRGVLLLAVAFGIGYAVARFILFPPPADVGAGIPVPDLRGEELGEARELLASRGLVVLEVVELPHPEAAAGRVIAQSPLPGQQLRESAGVRLAVSTGRPRGVVPSVAGLMSAAAAEVLARMGFQVEQRVEESPLTQGRVIRVEPAPGTELDLPARVVLYVSAGPPMPELMLDSVPGSELDTLFGPPAGDARPSEPGWP
jgi:serine/threonine-protein kinase